MPSINEGLFSGRAGIQSHGTAIAVLADNISNSNTVGYKASRADFTDLLSKSISGGGAVTTGSGSQVSGVTQIFNQGTFEFTGRGLDLGIDGNGFLIVQSQTGTRQYSRAGNLNIDEKGNLLNQNGFQVMGFPTGGSGGLEPLNVNRISQASINTQTVNIAGNLDASSATTGLPPAGSTFTQLNNLAAHSTFVDIYDSLGAAHTATVYYFKTGTNTWASQMYVDGSDITGGTAGTPSLIGQDTTQLSFSNGGVQGGTGAFTVTANWNNGAGVSTIAVKNSPFTQFSSRSNVSSINQDGTGGGSVASFNVEKDGTLFAKLNNGQSATVGVLGLAVFSNTEGLSRDGGSLFTETSDSGVPVVGQPGTGVFGSITAGALELSTSDIATDFVKLISYQRGFQGSSRIISNINDLLQEVVNLVR